MRLSKRFAHTFAALTFAVTAAVPSQAQDASDAFASVLCMKAAPGKATAFTDLQRETRPALQAMVDNTGLRSWYLARNWVPGAGAEADCDFQLISVHNSFPDLGATIEAMGRAWEQSKLPMTLPEYFAKRNAISHIVRREIWRIVAGQGRPEEGYWMKVDYQQRKDLPQHRENILKYHLPVHAAQVKEGSLKAWSVQQLYLPTGGDSRYNVKQHHWHPNFPAIYRPGGTSTSELLKKMFGVSLSDINPPSEGFKSEVYRVVQLVRPSRTTPSGAGQ